MRTLLCESCLETSLISVCETTVAYLKKLLNLYAEKLKFEAEENAHAL
jgi:hypothetical protein